MTQLVEWSYPSSEAHGSNPVVGKKKFCQLRSKDENQAKGRKMVQIKYLHSFIFDRFFLKKNNKGKTGFHFLQQIFFTVLILAAVASGINGDDVVDVLTSRHRRDTLDPHGEFCVDVSTYGPVIFNQTTQKKCDSTFTKTCEDKDERVSRHMRNQTEVATLSDENHTTVPMLSNLPLIRLKLISESSHHRRRYIPTDGTVVWFPAINLAALVRI